MPGLRNKKQKKSPIDEHARPLPQAGSSTRVRVLDIYFDKIVYWIFVAFITWSFTIFEWARYVFNFRPMHVWLTIAACIITAITIARWRWWSREEPNWILGLQGERAMAEALEELRRFGYRVFHDIQEDGYNIDHVLVGPGGVFAIETKTRSKGEGEKIKFDGRCVKVGDGPWDESPVRQAAAAANRVRDEIKRLTGREVFVRPVLAYAGKWWVDPPKNRTDVWVLNQKTLLQWIETERERLKSEDIALIAARIEDWSRRSLES